MHEFKCCLRLEQKWPWMSYLMRYRRVFMRNLNYSIWRIYEGDSLELFSIGMRKLYNPRAIVSSKRMIFITSPFNTTSSMWRNGKTHGQHAYMRASYSAMLRQSTSRPTQMLYHLTIVDIQHCCDTVNHKQCYCVAVGPSARTVCIWNG